MRTKRRAQAEYLANLIQSRQAADPTERIVSVGDYNAFQFNDGYVDSIGTIKGTPTPANQVVLASADLVNPDLMDLVDGVPASERYSFSFDGNAQELDHVLVTTGPQNRLTAIDLQYGRMDADFPEIYRNDPNRPERLSDHDPLVAYFSLAGPLDCTTAVANPPVMISTTTRSMRRSVDRRRHRRHVARRDHRRHLPGRTAQRRERSNGDRRGRRRNREREGPDRAERLNAESRKRPRVSHLLHGDRRRFRWRLFRSGDRQHPVLDEPGRGRQRRAVRFDEVERRGLPVPSPQQQQ